ncbi:methionine adenosyltransferase [Mycoplasma sp. Mirounga ES2805-ORL]|uniref:methionine adenosyltransferase n=1 Tax=Mycoplasma sp. Mirounga ES2805-ORL TaxID=754514 RepID=UPI00197CA582|nr:methionine adenosyltransferase [Mycoplasma sp. Mirounga ES2805-ORL]QSF13422.1 methionine adenosyltransferase [Mycoplasma sp. Mirounga ES2805-ORL]
MRKILFTSESVGQGHPDKICDQISDSILDAFLEQDKNSHVAIETMATGNYLIIAGEVNSKAKVNCQQIAINVLKKAGQFSDQLKIVQDIKIQSPDINQGVSRSEGPTGAGDQGIMFGFATNETKEYMPLPITLANALIKEADKRRLSGELKWSKSDMKAQVSIDYSDKKHIVVDTVLMSIQHEEDYDDIIYKQNIKNLIIDVLKKYNLEEPRTILINPTGRFVIGGPIGDTGLTGRKIIVDTYGGFARHGGGAFSGKDPSKVDRSAAYALRWIAKNLVAANVADKIELQVSYAIGVSEPVSIYVETFDTNKYPHVEIVKCIQDLFNLTPDGIISELKLKETKYAPTSYYGHFGRDDLDLPWERLNKVEDIKNFFKNK